MPCKAKGKSSEMPSPPRERSRRDLFAHSIEFCTGKNPLIARKTEIMPLSPVATGDLSGLPSPRPNGKASKTSGAATRNNRCVFLLVLWRKSCKHS